MIAGNSDTRKKSQAFGADLVILQLRNVPCSPRPGRHKTANPAMCYARHARASTKLGNVLRSPRPSRHETANCAMCYARHARAGTKQQTLQCATLATPSRHTERKGSVAPQATGSCEPLQHSDNRLHTSGPMVQIVAE